MSEDGEKGTLQVPKVCRYSVNNHRRLKVNFPESPHSFLKTQIVSSASFLNGKQTVFIYRFLLLQTT